MRADFVYGADLLAQAEAAGGVAFRHGDHLGSTRLLTDAAGSLLNDSQLNYSPYGEPLGSHGSLTTHPHAFTGQWRDGDLGLQYHRARWLKLASGNWLSPDPVFDFPNNFGNYYQYSGYHLITSTDLSGYGKFLEVLTIAGILGDIVSFGFSLTAFVNDPSIFNGAMLALDTISFIPASWLKPVAMLGVNTVRAGKILSFRKASEVLAYLNKHFPHQAMIRGELFELWTRHMIKKGDIPGLPSMKVVPGKIPNGTGNDLLGVVDGRLVVIEVTLQSGRNMQNAGFDGLLYYRGIAKRLRNKLKSEGGAKFKEELIEMGADPDYFDINLLNRIADGASNTRIPDWFKELESIVIVPKDISPPAVPSYSTVIRVD